jgi:CRISPR-associated protein Cmr2
LSRIAWEAMKVVCEALGPEAIVFPRLRGVPQVDLWLIKDCGLSPTLFADCEWKTAGSTDANPLFVAALPNRFTALVPANQAKALAESIVRHVRRWVMDQGRTAFRKLLNAAGMEDDAALYGYRQLEAQLAEFPEVHWASIPWSLISTGEGDTVASTETLCRAMKSFFVQNPPGFLGSQAWSLLSKQIELEQGWFWRPNPGTLYPALHELLDRVLAATKSLRPFGQSEQPGWRCSLTGEAEWLTTERSHLDTSPRTQTGTLWAKVTEQRPAWARKGEHLGALATLKRLWPSLFVDEIQDFLDDKVQRFVVSTHTMALTGAIGKWLNANNPLPADMAASIRQAERPALPRGLVRKLREHSDADLADLLARLPSWIEAADTEDDDRSGRLRKVLGQEQVESYYALTMMDGDRMGAWISGDSDFTLAHKSCFHPQIVAGLERFRGDPKFKQYAEAPRAANPARHMAISDALNNFALRLAPDIVELHHDGRLLYAGGDDLLAMLPVNKLLSAMAALRAAYSGIEGSQVGAPAGALSFSRQKNGFVKQKNGRLLRLMGDKATASIGAVVAHHKAPLNAVLGELRAAEQRAKQEGGRDAFSITVVKRSGGALKLTCRWRLLDESPSGGESPMAWLRELSEALADGEASRRAAYHVQTWSVDLPEPQQLGETEWRRMFSRLVAQQFERQGIKDAAKHAQRLATLAPSDSALKASTFINNFLSVAEFLCREARI